MTQAVRSSGTLAPPVGLRILIVSNGVERGYARARAMDELGYRVAVIGDANEAERFAREFRPGAVIYEPIRDNGMVSEVVERLRSVSAGPLIVIGVAGDLPELRRMLESGADDVCAPRVSTVELDLRLRALWRASGRRRPEEDQEDDATFRIGDLEIDLARQHVRKRGEAIALSPTEFRLLVTLAENAGKVVPSKALIARVWGEQYAEETHYLRLYVRYLRQKLEDDPSRPRYIVNRWGTGYALEEAGEAA